MRVLWFTNTPSLAEEKLMNKIVIGGWIKSLEKELKKNSFIHLGIAFYYEKKISKFEYKGTDYYPIFVRRKGKVKKFFDRIKHKIESDDDVLIFLDIIKSFKPDLIHIHGTEGPFGLIQKYINDIPIVLSMQGNVKVYHYKWFSGISREKVVKNTNFKDKILFKGFNNNYKIFTQKANREGEILSLTKNIIGRTDWDRRISSILAKNSKYYHSDEILRDIFYKKKWEKSFSLPFKIFTINGNNIYKGFEVILQTVKLLKNYGFNFEWNIAGLKNDDNIVRLSEKVFNINIPNNLKLLGILDEDELIKELLDSHLYVMPSHIENSPNNLCEAMILGMPCIATCAGGTTSLMKDGENGIIIQDGDPWSLAGAIIEMSKNYDKAIKYGVNARKVAMERHNPEKISKNIINIYKDLIKNK